MEAIWSGTISFSLVAIPVRLVKAIEPGHVTFHMLHSKDYSPLSRRMFCPEEKKIVPADEIIRGYEIGPDKFIVITDEELESVTPERSRTLEILEFIDINDVDTKYFDHPYYLLPSKGGEKAYRLLAEVMHRTNKAGLAKFVLREREYLVAVKNIGGALSVITLHYDEEILSDEDIIHEDEEVELSEKNRMGGIIQAMMADFNPAKYADKRRKKILAILEKKIKEKALVEAPQVPQADEGKGALIDLIAVLQESMEKAKKDQ